MFKNMFFVSEQVFLFQNMFFQSKTCFPTQISQYFSDARGRSESFTEHVDYSATVNYLTGESLAWSCQDGTVSTVTQLS